MTLRALPSVDALAQALPLPRGLAVVVAREAIDQARNVLIDGGDVDAQALALTHARSLLRRRHHRVINATGVLLHTNLGRAPLSEKAAEAAAGAATHYTNVEFDLALGERGGRGAYLVDLLRTLTGAESAHVVNNNAAALFLALSALADGLEVPVSRGELIEIGGSYRLPELMAATKARLVEVGTTNRTRAADFASAIGEGTGMVLKVHPSNYRVMGFAEDAPARELAAMAHDAGVPFVYDVGSGLVDAGVPWWDGPPPGWLHGEPGVVQELEAGADLVLFSGDKLFGGPQAGIIVGRADLVARLRRHPLARALRVDGPTMAALEVTAEAYLDDRVRQIPFWEMAARPGAELRDRLEALEVPGLTIAPGASLVGAGSVPGMEIDGVVGRLAGAGERWAGLIARDAPVVARRDHGDLVVDLRAVDPRDDAEVARALTEAS